MEGVLDACKRDMEVSIRPGACLPVSFERLLLDHNKKVSGRSLIDGYRLATLAWALEAGFQ